MISKEHIQDELENFLEFDQNQIIKLLDSATINRARQKQVIIMYTKMATLHLIITQSFFYVDSIKQERVKVLGYLVEADHFDRRK